MIIHRPMQMLNIDVTTKPTIGRGNTIRNLVHFDHHFATTMRLLSKPTTFANTIFVFYVPMQLQVYTITCATK
jgi:hypothetical protein